MTDREKIRRLKIAIRQIEHAREHLSSVLTERNPMLRNLDVALECADSALHELEPLVFPNPLEKR